jgi:hypothetical protein
MKTLIEKPNKKRILTASLANFALSHPRLLGYPSTQESLMILKAGVEEEPVARMDCVVELLKEATGGQRNE